MFTTEFYPQIDIARNVTANRLYAFPLIGFLVKIIMIIPVGIVILLLYIGEIFITIINSFVVLLTGKYWKFAFDYNAGLIRYLLKSSFWFAGLTDKYPGFNFEIPDFKVDISYPENPSRFFAIPFIGGLVRTIVLIPYFIWSQILGNGANFGLIVSFAKVLGKGEYPESTHEFIRDAHRVGQGATMYMMGLSDKYPSFKIDLEHHRMIKIILIIIGILSFLGNLMNTNSNQRTDYTTNTQYNITIPSEIPQTPVE